MAVDTATKRGAALRFGHGGRTRVATGVASAFDRGAGLGAYYQESAAVTDPNEGWILQSRSRVVISKSRERVSIPESRSRVWITKQE
jgi:hypothetical protein